ncbi:hypothetical protein [Pseudomonas argentinensis]|uniref:hypothetical protein n=1 Tax=Phytopseudomonas argentinensis TaxID=289370 RepID=UPI0008A9959B|nr:hypothetical protein [Pseudomonas argentinensis]
MYQAIGIAKTLSIFATLCLVAFIVLNHGNISALMAGPLPALGRAVSSSVAAGSLVLFLVGQTFLFPWICRLPLICKIFPPIDGVWNMRLDSNWGVIQKWLGLGDGTQLHVVEGKVRIKSRFFSVGMEFESNDRYSDSKTICVSVRPSTQAGLIELNYMFVNSTLVPVPTDSNSHNGAARVFLKEDGGRLFMEGTYFTDRNWTDGLNTAGRVTFTRDLAG